MINAMELMSIIFYIALIILIIVLIVLSVKAINTLNKVDKVVDDIHRKSSKLDGLFNVIDTTTDALVGISDTFISFIASGIESIFKRKKVKKDE